MIFVEPDADVWETTLFADEPLHTSHTVILEGTPGDEFAVDLYFDVFFHTDPMSPDPDAVILIDVLASSPPMSAHYQIDSWSNGFYELGLETILPPPKIHENEKL